MKLKTFIKERNAMIGCAMIWIVLYHAKINIPFKLYNFISSIGYGGVDICIFASGIGCYYSLNKSSDIGAFIKRRFIRLVPTYWSFLIFWVIYKRLHSEISVRGAFCNFLGLEYITNKGEAFNWYITALLLLYILAPYVKQLIDQSDSKKQLGILVGTIIASIAFWESKTYIIIFTRIPLFVLGMIFAQKSKEEKELSNKSVAVLGLIAVIGVVILKVCMDRYQDFLWDYGLYWYPFILITPGICICISIFMNCVEKNNGLKWIKQLFEIVGNNSFEIYLIHIPVFEYAHEIIEDYKFAEYRNYILIGALLLTILGCIILKMIVNIVVKVCKKGIECFQCVQNDI